MVKDHGYKFYLDKGISETNEGKFDEALESLDKAIVLNPYMPLAYFSKGIVYHNLRKFEEAYENYTKALNHDSKMTDAYFNRAQALLVNDNLSGEDLRLALKDFDKAIELDDKFIDAYYYAAVVEKKLKNYSSALTYLDKAIEIDPNAIHSKALKKLLLQKYIK